MSYDLFLLAHPDDELFAYPFLKDKANSPAIVAYLTNGSGERLAAPEVRQSEANCSVMATGFHTIAWIGLEQNIKAGQLGVCIAQAYRATSDILSVHGTPRRIITHSWEGGHPDHDAAHLLACKLARTLGIESASLSLPYYRAPLSGLWPFRVMVPLPINGRIFSRSVSFDEGFSAIRGILFHPSQIVSFIGLAPGMLITFMIRKRLYWQSLSTSSAPARPSTGKLLYERRYGVQFAAHVSEVQSGLASI